MHREIKIHERVTLNDAILLIGLTGWGNAGQVSTFTIEYLLNTLGATKCAEIPPDRYHNYQLERPLVSINRGVIESYSAPKNELYYWKNTKGNSDLLLFLGSEPHLNWKEYTQILLSFAEDLSVRQIYAIGGYLSDHTSYQPTITASTNNAKLIKKLRQTGVVLTNYNGPTSVYSEILWQARVKNVDVVSMWCGVPLYVRALYPPAVQSILEKIKPLTGLDFDLHNLRKKSESYKDSLSQAEKNYMRSIENIAKDRHKDIYIA